mgnify:CR=1 FL=1
MFWGAFNSFRRTNLIPLFGDSDAPRKGVTSVQILNCLQENLPTIAEPDSIFMQDNAPTHKAERVQVWLNNWARENGIELLKWPPYSLDLNPIENAWKILKHRICKHYPELADLPKNNQSKEKLIQAAIFEWDTITDGMFDILSISMAHRLQAVILANGWYTKY